MFSSSSIDDLRRAFTDDLINPGTSRGNIESKDDEVTHWHSTPLAFAILPAVGGLLFKNGSAFVTDVLLLLLAAIFMNWSIRLPWDWYYSAQAQRRDVEPDPDETLVDEEAVESTSSRDASPKNEARLSSVPEDEPVSGQVDSRELAAAELRRQEKLALLATFVFPVLAAYLLHVIREQLSRSSGSLVSDYNLTIFLLAAEIRPCRNLIRMITTRTLHLQRTVNGQNDPLTPSTEDKALLAELTSRMVKLETKLSDHTLLLPSINVAQKAELSDLSAEMRKRYEPRLEGLERAVRRYEKRSTTLAMLTEQRLGSLETRLQDALSLAAVAAQRSQTRSAFGSLVDSTTTIVTWPAKLALGLAKAPFQILDEVYAMMKGLLLGPTQPSLQPSKRSAQRSVAAKDERWRTSGTTRRAARG